MSTEIVKLENNLVIEKMTKFLNADIPEGKTKKHNGVNYLPIGYIEMELDSIFSGLWSIENIRTTVMLNSIVCELDLKIYRPEIGIWITRSGVGAVPIQLQKDQKIITGESIQTFAFQKGAPAAKAFALKNAAQSLGAVFGRNINRDYELEYRPLSESVQEFENKEANERAEIARIETQKQELKPIFDTIESIGTLADLKAFWTALDPETKKLKIVVDAINNRKKMVK
jgi:hypothetical protein